MWDQHYFVKEQTLLLATYMETIKEVGPSLLCGRPDPAVGYLCGNYERSGPNTPLWKTRPCCWLLIWKLLKKWAQHYFVEDQTLLLATYVETIKEVGPTLLGGRPDPAVGYLYGNN